MVTANGVRPGCSHTPDENDGWLGAKGFMLVSCEVDFRPGGASRLCMRSPEGQDQWIEGAVLELIEPERVVISLNMGIEGEGEEAGGKITFRRA